MTLLPSVYATPAYEKITAAMNALDKAIQVASSPAPDDMLRKLDQLDDECTCPDCRNRRRST